MSRIRERDVDQYLSRPDKWYVGGGDRLVWTPRYPVWLDVPGFWDEAHYYHHEIAPVFAVTLLDEEGEELPLRASSRRWRPSHVLQSYDTDAGLSADEKRVLLPDDVLLSELTIQNEGSQSRSLHAVVWTIISSRAATKQQISSLNRLDDLLRWAVRRRSASEPAADFGCALGIHPSPTAIAILPTEETPIQPNWHLTPFYDFGDVPRENVGLSEFGSDNPGPVVVALFADFNLPSGATRTLRGAFSVAPSSDQAVDAVRSSFRRNEPAAESDQRWNSYFRSVPGFSCSDEHLQKYYWYRWYGLRLFTTTRPHGNYAHPAVYEGPGYFRKLVSYSAQCHLLEMRWMHDPSPARGSLLNFIHNQRPDGSFYGHLFTHFGHEESFYHADWGNAWDLHLVHPNEDFLRHAYDGLSRYAAYFEETRDPENSGLYDILNHYETGQEYMHRYLAVDEAADQIHWGENFRLKGVDVATYMYEIKRFLEHAGRSLDDDEAADRWAQSAERTADAVRDQMWDAGDGMFSDLNPATNRRTGVKAAVCFYPYMTDIPSRQHLDGLKQHLLNPDEFWTRFPVPSSSLDDAFFSAHPHWKGRRMNCPWNGRVWPMANSHIAEALAQTSIRFDDGELRERTCTFIERFIRMMFFGPGTERPNCFEHYNPFNGRASVYRGIDDYQHSWVVDLIVQYVCGIRPTATGAVVDPFPFDLDHFRIENVPIRGRRLAVEREGDRFRIWIDGRARQESRLGEPIRLKFEPFVRSTDTA